MNNKKPPTSGHIKMTQGCIRAIAHLNIGMQVVFPLALSFTPMMVARAETGEKKFFAAATAAKTIPYVLQPSDTLAQVAEKHHLTVAQLKTLNQYRTFAHGFESVSAGDEIDVPVQSKSSVTDAGSDGSAELAQRAQQAGNFLQNNPSSDSAKDLARGQALGAANSKANQEVASWLNGKGKARVKLDADRDFSLKNSELDVLYPLWENNAHQVFTQGSVHHTDSRNQSNLGLGYRYFEGTYMLGANTFFDHDWSRSHSRLGLGAEYQRDFLKVAANAYMRLTNWKNSPDFDNYEERPANGWDIRTEGYLPAYPGIGGKLVYEQYYGDRVGLFGKDNQQKNPVAVTAGINYSPFPLMKFNVDHRMGKGNQNDTRFGIDLNYVLGAPLSQQLDSSMLAVSRSLAANRYDFVDRNNNIVLEYRKKDTISLRLASQISGYSGESKSLGVSMNSTNGVERIDWTAPELLSQGGQIVQVSEQQFNVIIPEYQYGSDANNSYVISGVAYDKSGNASPKAESVVIVASAAVSVLNSTLTPMELQLPNDGHSTAELTLVLRDANNHPISGVAGDIKTTVTPTARVQSDATVSAFNEDVNRLGTYKATVTAGKNIAEYKLTPEIQNIKIAPAMLYVGGAPMIRDLTISGKLALGEQLSGHYQFDSNNGNTQDASLYQWGNKGQTTGLNSAEAIVTSGSVPSYTLVTSDVGQVKELSVQARNGVETLGNTLTVTTVPGDSGNNTEGGGEGGTIVDEAAAPSISTVAISGKLLVGESLSGSYTFAANTGNPTDVSEYQWGVKGTTASVVNSGSGKAIGQSGIVPSYTLQSSDAGQVLEMSVRAKNGANVYGNTATVTTAQNGGGNNTEGGGDGGTIVDEQVAPSISTVAISGKLSVGEALSGSYTFAANTGNPTDASEYQWGGKGTTASVVDNGSGKAIGHSGIVPNYILQSSDAGQVLEMSVRAKNGANVYGNTATVTTAQNGGGNNTEGGGEGGTIVNEQVAPSISTVVISGKLTVGEALSGSYTFAANTGNPTDASEYQWGVKGTTASVVDNGSGKAIDQSGIVPNYTLQSSDAGQVLEMSVRAKNGANVYGNTATVTTAQNGGGNNTEGGGDGGTIVDETAEPSISTVAISGKLSVGEALSGSYTFAANTGNPTDASEYQWGVKGTTASVVDNGSGKAIGQSGIVPSYTLQSSDAGQVLEMSVRAKNGANVYGNTATVNTAQSGGGNNTEGGGDGGTIVDETAAPSISDVVMSGTLKVGEALNGRYTFAANTGNPTDTSEYEWGVKGSTASVVNNGNGSAISQSGVVPSYTVKSSDAGQVLEMSVRAKNGANVTGNSATVTTVPDSSGNETTGGGEGGTVVDETAAPSISDVVMSGTLKVGEALNGRYTFAANTGNPTDTSEYEWGVKGSTAIVVNNGNGSAISQSGVVPRYTVKSSDAGQVLEVSVRAKNGANVTGNTATVTTAPDSSGNETTGGGEGGTVVDETAAPSISDVVMSGTLKVGEALNGRYTFAANTGNPTDTSEYQWGVKGSTASVVNNGNGSAISQSGVVPRYTVKSSDAGQVLEVSVRAKNGANVTGNTATVTTAPDSSGNETTGGGEGGTVVDETAAPSISDVVMSGTLKVGEALNGRYTFAANTGNPTDTSEYQWGVKGSTASVVNNGNGSAISQSGVVPSYTVKSSDAGQVLEMSVRAKNGANVTGNSATVTTAPDSSGNETTGGGEGGTVVDETAAPSISDVVMSGTLKVGEALNGRYTFAANTGNPTDTSEYEWGVKGSTASVVNNGNGSAISQSGVVPSYTVKSSDAGQVLEVSVRAKNGANVTGNSATVTTVPDSSGNETTGGGEGGTVVDETAAPGINSVAISGKLAVGEKLSGRYTFVPNTGNPTDASKYQWGVEGTTANVVDNGNGSAINQSGVVPSYTVKSSDAGQVLEVSVLAKNGAGVTGNTETVTTQPDIPGNDTTGGGNGGTIINETVAPEISKLNISGELTVGSVLSGSYTFDPRTGNQTDASLAQWGSQSSTAGTVASQGKTTSNGTLPTYLIKKTDAGKVLEVSVLAKNGAGVTGNILTTDTSMAGNKLDGGNNGKVIDLAAAPVISNLSIVGNLEVGIELTGTYAFNDNNGSPKDSSVYLWGYQGATSKDVATTGNTVTSSGKVPGRMLALADAGKVMELSVQAVNGLNVRGNTLTKVAASVVNAPVVISVSTDKAIQKKGSPINLVVKTTYENTQTAAANVNVKFATPTIKDRQNKARTDSGKLLLNNTVATSYTAKTDSDGKLNVTVTDPNGIGVQTTLQVSSTDSTVSPVSTNVTFTVVTSPDTDKANMWGHMPNTLTAGGVVFKRPLLTAENKTNKNYLEINENWGKYTFSEAQAYCSKMPSKTQLVALYNAYPSNTLNTVQGWPTQLYRYRSGTPASDSSYEVVGMTRANDVGTSFNSSPDTVSCLQ
ncbi:inverse autotransporter beta domain-containing protein [Hafnia alvei]|uniref:inverse autotransporter beta domain-containing protein n=2 Tax=Hafnia alvei TaxID=569 RepID=UPI0013A660B0|nr:inverse autotransporter beta domain-containing protein [Hafnia alvei]